MSDYCKQCSIEHFGEDLRGLAGLGDGTPLEPEMGYRAICEGCGFILVDDDGNCVAPYCKTHGKHKEQNDTQKS